MAKRLFYVTGRAVRLYGGEVLEEVRRYTRAVSEAQATFQVAVELRKRFGGEIFIRGCDAFQVSPPSRQRRSTSAAARQGLLFTPS